MKPTFTLRTLAFPGLKFLALSLILSLVTQFSFAQSKGVVNQPPFYSNNDAGVTIQQTKPGVINTSSRPQAVCRTVNGDLQAGDLIINNRPNRDGFVLTPCVNKNPLLCSGSFVAPGCFYDTIIFTNPIASPQCIDIDYTLNSISGGNPGNVLVHDQTFVSVYLGTFVPANLCTNKISDPGISVYSGVTQHFSFLLPGSATAVIVVTSQEAITTANYTLVISAPVCSGVVCTATVNPASGSVCVGGTASFTVNATGGAISAYQWQDSTNTHTWQNIAGATSATLSLTNVTQSMNNSRYRANLTCGGTPVTSTSASLTVNPLPVVTITAYPTASLRPALVTLLTAASTPSGATYAWTFNGAPLTGATEKTVLLNVDGIGAYTVTVKDINGCVNTSAPFTISAMFDDRLFIYPNPAPNGQFQIRVYSGMLYDYRTISIYNAIGQRVYKKQLATTGPWQRMDVNLARMAAGVYVVEVSDENDTKRVVGKMIIER